jgi:hypothetical protein
MSSTIQTTNLHKYSLLEWYQRYKLFVRSHQKYVLFSITVYLVVVFGWMLIADFSITPDRIVVILFIPALLLGEGLFFLRDWVPFLVLILAYEALRGIADMGGFVHVTDIITAEKWLFHGTVPTIWLQQQLWHSQVSWYDWLATLVYFLHFPLPLVLAFYLWLKNRQHYWQFVGTFVLLCFSGFVTYIVFPAAPPWLAARDGALPAVTKIIDQVLAQFPHGMTISFFYHTLNPNQVAAMPSLHAAFPWLVFLMLWQVAGKKALWFLPYCLWLWFSIVYIGEHYVVDAIAGIFYASTVYILGKNLFAWLEKRPIFHRPPLESIQPATPLVQPE